MPFGFPMSIGLHATFICELGIVGLLGDKLSCQAMAPWSRTSFEKIYPRKGICRSHERSHRRATAGIAVVNDAQGARTDQDRSERSKWGLHGHGRCCSYISCYCRYLGDQRRDLAGDPTEAPPSRASAILPPFMTSECICISGDIDPRILSQRFLHRVDDARRSIVEMVMPLLKQHLGDQELSELMGRGDHHDAIVQVQTGLGQDRSRLNSPERAGRPSAEEMKGHLILVGGPGVNATTLTMLIS